MDFVPDIGVDYGHLKYIELNWAKPTHKHRCEWVIGPHKTWQKQLRVWSCNRKGTYTIKGAYLYGIHVTRAKSLHPETELPFKLFSYYESLIPH